MDARRFVEDSRQAWERLAAAVLKTSDEGVSRLDAETVRLMHEDYRRAAADLAYAQTHFPGSDTTAYLNRLVGRAHGVLYGSRPGRARTMWRFLLHGYPSLVRKHAAPMLVSAALLVGAAAVGYVLALTDYALARVFLPEIFRDAVSERLSGSGQDSGDIIAALAPLLSAGITVNNVQVALTAFAGGVTFGVYTAYALVRNGLLIGVLAGAYADAGLSVEFWSLIAPHGALELPAIVIAGGSGLVMARALLRPGDETRLAALKSASREAVRIVLGSIPLFIVAGIVEGFFTPLPYDPFAKIAFGTVALVVLGLYVGLGGRTGRVGVAPGDA